MGYTAPIILKLSTHEYGVLIADLSDGKTYRSDLKSFKDVYCFPQDVEEWKKVSIGEYGMYAIWASCFEVHSDQIITSAVEIKNSEQTA